MNKELKASVVLLVLASCFSISARNPIIQTKHTADPAPLAYNDTVFLYTGHDEDNAERFVMQNWMLYTSTDMVNWTDRGIIAGVSEPYKTFKWADGHSAWAPQCVARNGKFYLYCPTIYQGKMAIGVAVSNNPYGPFVDELGKPLIYRSNPGDYDPTVFVDDDGQAYIYWGGNGPCYFAKLNEDMISLAGDIQVASIDFTGTPPEASYTEGPWLWKKNKHYYLAWASRCCPEGIGYAMSDSPTGPWKCKGTIMDPDQRSSGNHPGIVDFKGNSYVFGFNYAIMKQTMAKHYERRSICVEKMTYNADGTIQKLPWWSTTGVKQIGALDPYKQNEAETMAYSEGVKTDKLPVWERDDVWNRGKKLGDIMFVTSIHNGDYIEVQGANFSKGCSSVDLRVASLYGGKIEIRIDKKDGPEVGIADVATSGEGDVWKTITAKVKSIKGVHDLYFVFKGEKDLFNFDWWQFKE
ncbi:family 43 glycosylhydrolase [Parabacteroides sp. FAFU027]|uniref:family 43 glycosylhydrolase n=1 Tax=Parabacteroides sp. FAFU027 TaxID=2922715 RepID=UPI001FB00614|nr:family 43 glycosylhydrolase [Parabacteroides sp. FAFU027]